jgi:hypothetical protein
MINLSKKFAVRIQSPKPFRSLKISNSSEHVYLITRRQIISEVSSTGKVRKILNSRKESKILASGISECSSLIAGLLSTGQIVICSKQKKIFQSFLLPPQIKLSIEIIKPDLCTLHIYERGLVLIAPNDQVWLWKAESNLKDPLNLSPHLKGTWINLNSSALIKGKSEVNTLRSSVSESRPNSNSSRPIFKSRFTTHGFSIKTIQDYLRGHIIGVLRVWLRSINEDSCVIESRYLLANLTADSKNEVFSVSSVEEFTFKGQLQFWSKKGHKDMVIVVRLDHSSSLIAIGVNSSHPYFCQLVFMSPTNGICSTRKICNYATVDDIPVTTNDGQTSFWIDDIVWSPDDAFLAVAFKSGFLSIFNRLGEPIEFILDMIRVNFIPRVFSHAFFTTDPESLKKYGGYLSIDWKDNNIVMSDGFTICELGINKFPEIKELVSFYIPNDGEVQDISINISHETSPIPSEMDSGPKRKNIELAFQLLRSLLSNSHANDSKNIIFTITNWIDNLLPPQLHEEIKYTAAPNSRFDTETRLSNNLVLKKKVHAIDVYSQFNLAIGIEKWTLVQNSELKEWIASIAYQVFKYMIADQQALYAWNVLKLFERWTKFKLQRIRNILILYSLVQYRNHQANHINVVYFLIAYAAIRGNYGNFLPVLSAQEEEFLRTFIKKNLEISQQTPSKSKYVLSSAYYLESKTKEKFDGLINYTQGYPNNFSDTLQETCSQLIKGNLKYSDSYLSADSLILFAYYFDFSEPFFISPIEIVSLNLNSSGSIYEILSNLQKLSQIPVQKDKKYQKDSAFLYWILGVYTKLEKLLNLDLAFYAINKMIPILDPENLLNAVQVLKRIFEKENRLKLVELCHPKLKKIFQKYSLVILKQDLKDYLISERYKNEKSSNNACDGIFEIYKSSDLADYLITFKSSVGGIQALKDKGDKWLDLEHSNFPDDDSSLSILINDIIKYFWCIHIQEHIHRNSSIDWKIRLLSFADIYEKNKILESILSDTAQISADSPNIVSLYLRNSMFPNYFNDHLQIWKEKLKKTDGNVHILHTLTQPAYANPWIFDPDFLNFAEKLSNLSIKVNETSESVIKSWNSSVKSLKKQYKTSGFLKYEKGVFSEAKENENFDITPIFSIFYEPAIATYEEKGEIQYMSPIAPNKKRIGLEFNSEIEANDDKFAIQQLICIKKLGKFIKSELKKVLSLIKNLKKTSSAKAVKLPESFKDSFFFFTLKSRSDEPGPKTPLRTLSIKLVNVLESQQKHARHKRIQSVVIPSSAVQKPFQLIRLQKSSA